MINYYKRKAQQITSGGLIFYFGTMKGGKSTHLLQKAYELTTNGFNIIVVKPKIDEKGGDRVTSRLKISRKADYLIKKDLYKELDEHFNLKMIDAILIDEVQFLSEENIDDLMAIKCKYHIPIECYGLKVDFTGHLFEGSRRLLEIADYVEEITTMCKCGNKATFNIRIVDGEVVFEGDTVVIDNDEKKVEYKGVCSDCFWKLKNKIK